MKGFVVSGTGSGVGKTSIASGLMSVLSKKYKVQAFKAGPDFIDPMYHTVATGRPGRNLDSFMMTDGVIRNVAGYASKDADLCVVEGVRGLHEGFSADDDTGSTAHIAKVLGLPVVLVVDARSLNRSVGAIINGFRSFDPDVKVAGAILNNVSGKQHEDKLRDVMRIHCPEVELLGIIRHDRDSVLGQRYLGLHTLSTFDKCQIEPLENLVAPVDLDRLMGISENVAGDLPSESPYVCRDAGMTAAVPMDDAYCFYYRDNIECLEASGIKVRTFRPADGDPVPDADMMYLGGGYPELYAGRISENADFLEGTAQMAAEGKPILGECGGLMSLCRSMRTEDGTFRMAGVFAADADMVAKRHGPTYMLTEALPDNPLFRGSVRGHEYHYSEVVPDGGCRFGFRVDRGLGIADRMDGLVSGNAVGTYMHQHALSADDWASGFVEASESLRR